MTSPTTLATRSKPQCEHAWKMRILHFHEARIAETSCRHNEDMRYSLPQAVSMMEKLRNEAIDGDCLDALKACLPTLAVS
jgi:hypothetical protein